MSRTRGIPDTYAAQALNREGRPAGAREAPHSLSAGYVADGPGVQAMAADAGRIIAYRADKTTFARNMEAFDLAMLLDLMLSNPGELGDGFAVEITQDQYNQLSGDVRRHFMAVRT